MCVNVPRSDHLPSGRAALWCDYCDMAPLLSTTTLQIALREICGDLPVALVSAAQVTVLRIVQRGRCPCQEGVHSEPGHSHNG